MKPFYITLFIFAVHILSAQKIAYAYSPSGNRIQRKFDLSAFRVGTKDSTESAKEFPKLVTQEGISVYPNPAKETVQVSINTFDATQKNTLTIIDIKGAQVLQQTIETQTTEINLSTLKAGIYFLKLVKNETILSYKLIKTD